MLCLVVNGVSSIDIQPRGSQEEVSEEQCPPCEVLFSKLKRTGRSGKLAQHVKVQERGEPKSGTTVMYRWARASMTHTCNYLQELFGEESPAL